ncbi:hypothetical protein M5K25_011624 [Dendrobium thyrsiflorum]|uniref:Sugar phosphate transporter domain-containing protein n=1 Tax=Dendrobium thyrsiflorum TaxID=117978 RepID=A0ABD0VA80_DENTH
MGEKQRFQLGTVGALSLSVVSSVSIVICNKALISALGFTFEVERTIVGGRQRSERPLFGDGGQKDRSLATEVGRNIIGGQRRSKRPLSGDIGRKNRSRCATEVRKIVVWRRSHNIDKLASFSYILFSSYGLFEHKPFDSRAVTGFGILNGCSIGLLNLSLGFNSVGFYQMTKLAIIPCTVLLETFFFRKKFRSVFYTIRSIQLSLAILLLGVGIATVTDLQLNILGSILSLLAIVTTCIAQIMTNTIQKRFKVSSTQLLYQSCPYQAITLFIIGPFLDGLLTKQNVFAFKYTPEVLVFIVVSCLISVSVNFSTFLVIGKTSPVTYQVLGHLKTCLVLAFGYVLLRDPFSWRNIFGISVAVVGMVLYSYHCTIENQQKASEVILQLSQFSFELL